jgi:hypothetical protein
MEMKLSGGIGDVAPRPEGNKPDRSVVMNTMPHEEKKAKCRILIALKSVYIVQVSLITS